MQMGLLMLGDAPVQTMVERARLAEAVGYGTVWLADERFYGHLFVARLCQRLQPFRHLALLG